MNRLKVITGVAVVLGLAVGADAGAKKSTAASKTLTGCLQKGPEAGTYTLTNVSGGPAAVNKEWVLMGAPAALKMDEHVGHKVSVTGKTMGVGAATKMEHKTTTTVSDAAPAATDTKVETKVTKEDIARHLNVVSMKHVAATCP